MCAPPAGRSLGGRPAVNAAFRSPPPSGSRPGPVRFVAARIRAEAASRRWEQLRDCLTPGQGKDIEGQGTGQGLALALFATRNATLVPGP
jgi:hypothetical protein